MPFFETADRTRLYYTDWGTGAPVVFVSCWASGGAIWEYQMVPLSERNLRCITYDRRGHGRSDDPGRGYDFDTLADDLAALLAQLDLREVTLVGHSTGCCEIARYLAHHGTSRIARVALISPATPFQMQTEDNPEGAPKSYLEQHLTALSKDRPVYFSVDGAIAFFGLGSTWPEPPVLSSEMVNWTIQLLLDSSPKAVIELRRTAFETDFRPDMRAFSVPTLIIHGDNDQSAPLEMTGRRTAKAIPGSELRVYAGAAHGLFLTHKDRLNADLLEFIQR
jgi:non-heme chloroperoxidase